MAHPALLTFVIYFAGLGAAGQFSKLAIGFTALSGIYDASPVSLGLTVSLISAVGVALGLAAGLLVARIGYSRALVWALGIGALLSLWQSTLPSLPVMMITRVIEGMSHLMIVVAAPTLIAERVTDSARPAALTLWSTFFGVAFAITAAFGTPLIAARGLDSLLMVHGAWMGLAAVACFAILYKDPRKVEPQPLALRALLRQHVTAYQTPAIATPALVWLCYTLTFVSVLTALPLLTDPVQAPWLAGSAPLLSIVVALTLGIALLRIKPALNVVQLGFVAATIAALIAAATGFSGWSILLLFAAMALVQGSGFAMVPELNKQAQDRATANGGLAQMGNLGNLTGTPILIWLYTQFGTAGALAFLLIAYLAGLTITCTLGKRA